MEDFWDSICRELKKRHPTLKFRWELNIDNNGIDFKVEYPCKDTCSTYILVFFDNKYISYDTDYEYAIVDHISDIIFNEFQKFKEDLNNEQDNN